MSKDKLKPTRLNATDAIANIAEYGERAKAGEVFDVYKYWVRPAYRICAIPLNEQTKDEVTGDD